MKDFEERYLRLGNEIISLVAQTKPMDRPAGKCGHYIAELQAQIVFRSIEYSTLGTMLIEKGIITQEEFRPALIAEMERDIAERRDRLAADSKTGTG